jgi:hypothetical protein
MLAHRRVMEDYERRMRDNEALLSSRMEVLKEERKKFEI